MQRKKIFKYMLTVVILLGFFSGTVLTASAAGEVTVQVKDVSVSAGQTVTTEMIMNGSFAAFQGSLIYDTNALTLENIEATSLLSESMTMFNKDEVTGKFTSGTFVSVSAKNAAVNGTVFKITFKAGSNAKGTYSFSLEQFKIFDENGAQLTVIPVNTTIEDPDNPSPSGSGAGTSPNNAGTGTSPNNSGTTPSPNGSGAGTSPNNSGTTPSPNDAGAETSPNTSGTTTSPDSAETDTSPGGSETSAPPDSSGGSYDPDDPAVSSDPNNPDPNNSGNRVSTVILLIFSAITVVGIVLAVIMSRKKKKKKM